MRTFTCDACAAPIDPRRRYRLQSFQAHDLVDSLRRHPYLEADLCLPCLVAVARAVRPLLAAAREPKPEPEPARLAGTASLN